MFTPEELRQLKALIGFVHYEALSHHRALLHILSKRGVFIPEQAEREMDEWIHARRQELAKEAIAVLKQFYGATPGPPSPPASPSEDPPNP